MDPGKDQSNLLFATGSSMKKKKKKKEREKIVAPALAPPPMIDIARSQPRELMEPPRDLTSKQRKRWLKRQKANMKRIEQAESAAATESRRHSSSSEDSVTSHIDVADSTLRCSTPLDGNHGTVTRTVLMRPPVKHWNDSNPGDGDDDRRWVAEAGTLLEEEEHPSGGRTHDLVVGRRKDSSDSVEAGPGRGRRKYDHEVPLIKVTRGTAESSRPGAAKKGVEFLGFRSTIATRTRASRLSTGSKPLDVTSFPSTGDTESTLNRFKTFLRKNDAEDSDESDESESESEDEHLSRPNMAGSIPESFAEQLREMSDPVRPVVHQEAGAHDIDVMSNKEKGGVLDGGGEDRGTASVFSDPSDEALCTVDEAPVSTSAQTLGAAGIGHKPFNASTWPANVGMKRTLLSEEAGGARSGPGLDPSHEIPQEQGSSEEDSFVISPSKDFAVDPEEYDNVYDNIEDISNHLFKSTRPLPKRKLPSTREPSEQGENDEDLTDERSDRDMNHQSGATISANEIYLGNGNVKTGAQTSTSNTDESDNIVVTPRSKTKAERQYCQVSSFASATGSLRIERFNESRRETADAPSHGHEVLTDPKMTAATEEEAISSKTEKKKKKMTGMTSKHFSPIKPKKPLRRTSVENIGHGSDAKASTKTEVMAPAPEPSTPKREKHLEGEGLSHRTRSSSKMQLMSPKEHSREEDKSALVSGEHMEETRVGIAAQGKTKGSPAQENVHVEQTSPSRRTRSTKREPSTRTKRKSTGKVSEHFKVSKVNEELLDRVDLYTPKGKKVPAGTSIAPVPPINADKFGIIQEKLWNQPFWLIIAVTFLNKTTGRAAVPVFWSLKERFPSPEALANANQEDVLNMVKHLGLQNQRSKTLIKIADSWITNPPVAGRRYRTLNYPGRGDGKATETPNIVEEDATLCNGALEIGHIPACGAYAYDSWRIFCRDALRGVADDFHGKNAKAADYVPEWQRVVPLDKELRACLRWMWLREGWIWDPLTGNKRRATPAEMELAERGEMEIEDPTERKFAAQAAGMPLVRESEPANGDAVLLKSGSVHTEEEKLQDREEKRPREQDIAPHTPTPEPRSEHSDEAESDTIVVSTPAKQIKTLKKSQQVHKTPHSFKSKKGMQQKIETEKDSLTSRRSKRLAQ